MFPEKIRVSQQFVKTFFSFLFCFFIQNKFRRNILCFDSRFEISFFTHFSFFELIKLQGQEKVANLNFTHAFLDHLRVKTISKKFGKCNRCFNLGKVPFFDSQFNLKDSSNNKHLFLL